MNEKGQKNHSSQQHEGGDQGNAGYCCNSCRGYGRNHETLLSEHQLVTSHLRALIIARYEWVMLAIIGPLMLFPGKLTPAVLVPLAVVWTVRGVSFGRLTRPSLMNAPIIGIVLMAVVGYAVSAQPELSWPKLWGIVLQASAFFVALNGLGGRSDSRLLALSIVLLTLVVSLISLFGTNWDVVRLMPIPALYDNIPRLIRNVPDSGLSPTQDLFHPRQVGATLGMLLPFVTAFAAVARGWVERLSALAALVFGAGVLLLTQSIMGILGLLVGWSVLLTVWRPKLVWLAVPIGFTIAAAVIYLTDSQSFLSRLLNVDDPVGIGVVLRLDMWSRALAMITDVPLTGIGLNTFPIIQSHFYIGHLIGAEPHAHNLILQTAVDLGLPGLSAFLWLTGAIVVSARRALTRCRGTDYQALVVGVGASISAYVVGGTLDVMTIGSKPMIALFLLLGMLGAIDWFSSQGTMPDHSEATPSRRASHSLLLQMFVCSLLLVVPLVTRPATLKTNFALLESNRVILSARQGHSIEQADLDAVADRLDTAIESDPTNPELHAALGNVQTLRNRLPDALDSWEQRVVIDLEAPLSRYAPFLTLTPEWGENASPGEQLVRVYRQWQVRFPERAEGHMLVAIAAETALGDRNRAINAIMSGKSAGATPSAILTAYLDWLTADEQ